MPKGRGARRKTAKRRNAKAARARQEKELDFTQPGATEDVIRERNRRMRQATHDAAAEDGIVTGTLRVAAMDVVEDLQMAYGLEGEEHRVAIIEYLVGAMGELIHAFPETPEFLPGYLQWRDESRARVTGPVEAE